MKETHYNISKNHVIRYTVVLTHIIVFHLLLIYSLLPVPSVFDILAHVVYSELIIVLAMSLIWLIVFFLLLAYVKRIQLIIDEKGVRVSKRWLDIWSSKFADVKWQDITAVHYIEGYNRKAHTRLSSMIKVIENDKTLLITHQPRKQKFAINMDEWGIADITDVRHLLIYYGCHVTDQSVTDAITAHSPHSQDMEKKVGWLAYGAVLLMLMGIVLSWFDQHITLEMGIMFYINVLIFIVTTSVCFVFIHTKRTLIINYLIVASLFGAMGTFAIYNGVSHFAQSGINEEPIVFKLVKQNDSKQKKWVAVKHPDYVVSCKENPHSKSTVSITTLNSFGMLRIKQQDICGVSK